MSDESVTLDLEGDVATATIERPDVRNALTGDVSEGLIDAVDAVEGSDARCLVIEGSEGDFCAGGDVNMMVEGLTGDVTPDEKERTITQYTHRSIARVARCPIPTIAKVDGAAFGAGGSLTLACDLVLASDDARISFGFRQVGLALDSGASALLPRVVGMHVAKELAYTGEVVEADRAEDLGLFNRVYPVDEFDERVREFAERIAAGPTTALKTTKHLLDRNVGRSLEAAMDAEAAAQAGVLETDDHREGAEAFIEGREPEFTGE
ncbi:enoyl-CoA hydratase [Halobacteriales archaeon QS_8_69_26]|nr:MAG: enoyl-CoA hydratase [Halobacteriales archaeon QS_8_69_26]